MIDIKTNNKSTRIVISFGFTLAILLILLELYHANITLGEFKVMDFLHKTIIAYIIGTLLSVALLLHPTTRKYSDLNLSGLCVLLIAVLLWGFSGDITFADIEMPTILSIVAIMSLVIFCLSYGYKFIAKTT